MQKQITLGCVVQDGEKCNMSDEEEWDIDDILPKFSLDDWLEMQYEEYKMEDLVWQE